MRLLALHLHHVANTTKVGICGAHRLRPNQLLDLNVCHLRLMDGQCVPPDALQRPVSDRQGREHGTEGAMQNPSCTEELKLERYSV